MAETNELHDPWLVAVWPGMGNVAVGAGGYLINKLGAHLAHELSPRDTFEIRQVEVKGGLARVGRMPRNLFFEWKDPGGRHDLIVFLAEAQPSSGGYELCHRLLDHAMKRGAKRVFTFAAMATQLHPSSVPRVFGVATDEQVLSELKEYEAEILDEGQISGLNGVLLAAASERRLPGACLLGELPFFAAGVPNPRASQAVLQVFTALAGITVDFTEIARQAKSVEGGLLQLLEKLKETARQQSESEEESFSVPELGVEEEDEAEPEDESRPEPDLDYATRRRIETLFEAAHRDRNRAFALKSELDRLGVFKLYEDRFLDLFKKAE
ncbi:MAG: PAC2 family protein [Planctomycetota bacterium]|jgi:proteasome assembly chaperone (PAC2) family protein